jgi:hypothetical protein
MVKMMDNPTSIISFFNVMQTIFFCITLFSFTSILLHSYFIYFLVLLFIDVFFLFLFLIVYSFKAKPNFNPIPRF